MIIKLEPYWQVLIDYYWENNGPDIDGSVWDWLEKDYRARRIPRRPRLASEFYTDEFDLVFDNDADATFFLLRWS